MHSEVIDLINRTEPEPSRVRAEEHPVENAEIGPVNLDVVIGRQLRHDGPQRKRQRISHRPQTQEEALPTDDFEWARFRPDEESGMHDPKRHPENGRVVQTPKRKRTQPRKPQHTQCHRRQEPQPHKGKESLYRRKSDGDARHYSPMITRPGPWCHARPPLRSWGFTTAVWCFRSSWAMPMLCPVGTAGPAVLMRDKQGLVS